MRRLSQTLFSFLAALSLIICLAAIVLMLLPGGPGGRYHIIVIAGGSLFIRSASGQYSEIPSNLVFLATVILPLAWLAIQYSRWKRKRALTNRGRCPRCGYDCRATPDRCPECGTILFIKAS